MDRGRDEPAWRRHGAVGRAGRLLLRRDADARRLDDPAEGPLARRAAAAVRGDRVRRRAGRALPGAARARSTTFVEHFADAMPALAHLPGPNPEGRRMLALVDEPRLRRILAIMLDEDEFLGPHGIRAISRRHLEQPCRVRLGRPALRGSLPARGVRHRHVRRQLELARAGVVPDEPGDPARALPAAPLLRRPAEGRVPDRLGKRAEPARGRARDRRPPDRRRSSRTRTAAGRCSAGSRSSRPIRTGTTCCCSTSTSTATTAPASAPATRPAGPARSRCCSCSAGALRAEAARVASRSADDAPARPPDGLRDQHRGLAGAARPAARPRSARCRTPTGTRSRRCRSTRSG